MNLTLSDFRKLREMIVERMMRAEHSAGANFPDEQRAEAAARTAEWEELLARFDADLQDAYDVQMTCRWERERGGGWR